jgi:hypothetical protein
MFDAGQLGPLAIGTQYANSYFLSTCAPVNATSVSWPSSKWTVKSFPSWGWTPVKPSSLTLIAVTSMFGGGSGGAEGGGDAGGGVVGGGGDGVGVEGRGGDGGGGEGGFGGGDSGEGGVGGELGLGGSTGCPSGHDGGGDPGGVEGGDSGAGETGGGECGGGRTGGEGASGGGGGVWGMLAGIPGGKLGGLGGAACTMRTMCGLYERVSPPPMQRWYRPAIGLTTN